MLRIFLLLVACFLAISTADQCPPGSHQYKAKCYIFISWDLSKFIRRNDTSVSELFMTGANPGVNKAQALAVCHNIRNETLNVTLEKNQAKRANLTILYNQLFHIASHGDVHISLPMAQDAEDLEWLYANAFNESNFRGLLFLENKRSDNFANIMKPTRVDNWFRDGDVGLLLRTQDTVPSEANRSGLYWVDEMKPYQYLNTTTDLLKLDVVACEFARPVDCNYTLMDKCKPSFDKKTKEGICKRIIAQNWRNDHHPRLGKPCPDYNVTDMGMSCPSQRMKECDVDCQWGPWSKVTVCPYCHQVKRTRRVKNRHLFKGKACKSSEAAKWQSCACDDEYYNYDVVGGAYGIQDVAWVAIGMPLVIMGMVGI